MCSAGSHISAAMVEAFAEEYARRTKPEPPKPHWWQLELLRLDRIKVEAAATTRQAMVGTVLLCALIGTGAYALADWLGWFA